MYCVESRNLYNKLKQNADRMLLELGIEKKINFISKMVRFRVT